MGRPLASLTVAFLVLASGWLAGSSSVSDARVSAHFGVYLGAANPARVREFGAWVGRQPTIALDYLDDSSWATLEKPDWWATAWSQSGYQVVYSVALIPESGGTLAAGASGAYNTHFRRLADALVRHGQGDAVLRLGWEFNGDWTRWSARKNPAAFAAYWRQIVTTMRAVPGARFKYDWCVAIGHPTAVEAAYPGDAYVDYIGMDAYDTWWSEPERTDVERRWQRMLDQPGGLEWHRDFARAHGKRMTYPEWGLWKRPDGHGGGDNPYYLEKMHAWISRNDVAYHIYFEFDAPDGQHRLMTGQFPRGATAFRRLFARPAPAPSVRPQRRITMSTEEASSNDGPRRLWRGDRVWRRIGARR